MANEKRLIDANALAEEHCKGCAPEIIEMCKADPVCASMMWVVEAPTVDASEVVRCKDCKHRYTLSSGHSFCREYFPMGKYDDDFCSYGERKDNES